MVKYKTILKIIDTHINKHNQFRTNINRILRNITDNQEEYKQLKKEIWDYWKHQQLIPLEYLRLHTHTNEQYSKIGTEKQVSPPYKASYIGLTEGLWLSSHNHPNNYSCFQSLDDFETLLLLNQKYSCTFGKDGFMIVKNEHTNFADSDKNLETVSYKEVMEIAKKQKKQLEETDKEYAKIMESYNRVHHKIYEDYINTHDKEFKEIAEQCINGDDVDFEKYDQLTGQLYQDHLEKNIRDITEEMNNEFKDTQVKVYYCGKYDKKKDDGNNY